MKLKDIINIIENEYPLFLCYDWDNAGLFYGDLDKEIKKITVSLDVCDKAVQQAISNGSQLLLTHHPIIMSGIKKLSDNTMSTNSIIKAIKNDLAIYSAHTNMDTAKNGINQKLAELFGLKNIEIMVEDKEDECCGLGRVGDLDKEITLYEFCQIVKQNLNTPFVRVCGEDRRVKRVALASGGCSEFVPDAIKKGADVIVTADMKYHNCMDYVYDGIAIIDAGHYPTELICQQMFAKLFEYKDVEIEFAKYNDVFVLK